MVNDEYYPACLHRMAFVRVQQPHRWRHYVSAGDVRSTPSVEKEGVYDGEGGHGEGSPIVGSCTGL